MSQLSLFEDDLNPDEREEINRTSGTLNTAPAQQFKWKPGEEPFWEAGNALSNLIRIDRLGWDGRDKQKTYLEITVAMGPHIGRRARVLLLLGKDVRFLIQEGMKYGLVAKLLTEEIESH